MSCCVTASRKSTASRGGACSDVEHFRLQICEMIEIAGNALCVAGAYWRVAFGDDHDGERTIKAGMLMRRMASDVNEWNTSSSSAT